MAVGPLLCLLSAAAFGAMAVFAKLGHAAGVSTDALLLLRFTLAALVLGAVLALRPELRSGGRDARSTQRRRIPRRVVLTALGLGAIGYATQATLFFSSLERIDASLSALVLYTYPAMVTVAAALLGRERLTRARAVAVLVASGGTLLVLLGAGALQFDPIGVGLAFGAAAVFTAYILVSDTVAHRLAPVPLALLVMVGAAATLSVRALLTGGVDLGFGPAGWLWVACIAVVSTVVAMLTFFAGLRRTGPSTLAILSTFEPVVTAALAASVLGELLTPLQLVGGLLVLASVVIVQRRPRADRPARPVAGAGDVAVPVPVLSGR